ncbi:MAG: response regulator transcription factor [Betaproteobacteria bacterium]|nr:response regulator transcription factor [Betaproteobacteria bacterium]
MLRIFIADDHAVVRAGLRHILEDTGEFAVVGEAANGVELLELVRSSEVDLVILDLSMPGRGGVEILPRLREERPRLPVLILSTYPEEQYAVRLIKAGAAGYLNKESAPELLVRAVRQIFRNGRYISETVAELLANQVAGRGVTAGHEQLSNREYEVLRLLGSGKTVSEVAEKLSLSVKTVSTYRTRLLAKLGLHGNADLIRYVIESRLAD